MRGPIATMVTLLGSFSRKNLRISRCAGVWDGVNNASVFFISSAMSPCSGLLDFSADSKRCFHVSAGVKCGCYTNQSCYMLDPKCLHTLEWIPPRPSRPSAAEVSPQTLYRTGTNVRKKSAIKVLSARGCSGPTATIGFDFLKVSKPELPPTISRHTISCSTWWNKEMTLRRQFSTSTLPYVTEINRTWSSSGSAENAKSIARMSSTPC